MVGCDAYIFKEGYFVLGYTKSGTNWLCLMISRYLGMPVFEPWIDYNRGNGPYVFHLHRFLPLSGARKRTVYLMRDGRDAVISRYHAMLDQPGQSREREQFSRIIGCIPTAEDITQHLPAWIEFLRKTARSSVDWKRHVERGLREYPHRVRYLDLKERAVQTMSGVIKHLTGNEADLHILAEVVDYYSFDRMKERAIGDRYAASFLRLGAAGSWRKVFDRKSAEVFAHYAGQTLIDAGFEKSNSWIRDF